MAELLRRFAALVVSVLALSCAGAGSAQAGEVPCDKRAEQHKNIAFGVIDVAYRHQKWRDPSLVTNEHRNRITGHRKCLGDYGQKRVGSYRGNAAESRDDWRERKKAAYQAEQFQKKYRPYGPCGSAGYLAIPCYVAFCESGYRWGIHSGMYGILDSTWHYYAPSSWGTSYAGQGTPDQQSMVATWVLRDAGPGAWECW